MLTSILTTVQPKRVRHTKVLHLKTFTRTTIGVFDNLLNDSQFRIRAIPFAPV